VPVRHQIPLYHLAHHRLVVHDQHVQRATLRRPFLALRRADTERICRAYGLEWWTDPHNSDPRFARSRVRTVVLPTLEHELGPGVTAALARTADLLREDAESDPVPDVHLPLVLAMQRRWVIGTPESVAEEIRALAATYGVDEVMVHPVAGAFAGTAPDVSPAREQTLTLLADELL
jgi:alkanesulfonate monooxygenase SsuD/methylene tetrahydromethanopterin reductase-like flavin-dependent oxidoreductase (luciferase family)